ncbi:MAG: type II secretion system F family protein [Halieaceae bacterium]|jgi:type IV pilus assembly protein PilC
MATLNTFVWTGLDKSGRKNQGEVLAASQALAKAQLRMQGISARTVRRKVRPLVSFGSKKIKSSDIALFTRQMATMMKAGVPLIQSFDIVADGLENQLMRNLVTDIKTDVAAGGGLAASLARHPKYFDDLFCSLVSSGENSGTLEVMLDRVATYKEKTEALRAKIKKAMTYPIAVMVVAIVVTGILLVKVVPTFAETFKGFGADLPDFTLLVLRISEFVQAWWFILLFAVIVASWSYSQAMLRSKQIRDRVDALSLKLPVVGGIIHDSVVARFSRTLSTTFAAGVPLVEALESTAGAAGNSVYSAAVYQIRDDVTGGTSLYQSIRSTGLFPTMLLQMISIGEQSGALDEMLGKVADQYETLVDHAVDNLSSLMEPLVMSILGVLIGGLMIAMYLPIFMLGSVI